MDVKLMLAEREITAGYADEKGFSFLLRMHILGHRFALNAQGYFYRSTYDALLAGQLKGFTYSKEKVEGSMATLPKISS